MDHSYLGKCQLKVEGNKDGEGEVEEDGEGKEEEEEEGKGRKLGKKRRKEEEV